MSVETAALVVSAIIAASAVGALWLNARSLRQTRDAVDLNRRALELNKDALDLEHARTAADVASRDPGLSVRLDLCAYGYGITDDGLSGPPYGEILVKSRIDVYVRRIMIIEVQIGHPRVPWKPANAEATPATGAFEYQGGGEYPVHVFESDERWFFWPDGAEIPRLDVAEVTGWTTMDAPDDMGHYKVHLEVVFAYEPDPSAYLVSRHFTFDVQQQHWHGDKVGNLGSPNG